jgi:UDP-3-O-[3-hydroxymyristoyl] glucosamine N-acyltransferase
MQTVRAIDICKLLNGRLEGNPDVLVSKPAKIEAGEAGAVSFFGNPKYERFVYTCASSLLLLPEGFVPSQPILAEARVFVQDVYASVGILLQHFEKATQIQKPATHSPQAYIDASAEIAEGVRIDAFAYVAAGAKIGKNVQIYPQVWVGEGVEIGANTILYPGVKIYPQTVIGKDCILHAGAVIGKDGFGFAPQPDGSYQKIPQLGRVFIEDKVEIGANTVIDRATMDITRIGEGVKLDNLIQIAHNVSIGKHTVIAAQAGIAGSAQIGKNCMIGGQSGIVGHIQVADFTKVQAQSGVDKAIKTPNTAVYGSPALPYNDYLRSYVGFKNLPNLQQRLYGLEKAVSLLIEKKD